jgi:UDP-N-acetylglucosamine transferase subunit ALG13
VILVLVGTSHLPFIRLLKAVDKLSRNYDLEVKIQFGHTTLDGTELVGFDFCTNYELLKLMEKSTLIVCQAGFGSMFDAIKSGKRVIVIPRKVEFGETDAEQMSLARYYSELGLVELCENPERLSDVYANPKRTVPVERSTKYPFIKDILKDYI